jgi:hypothetical protein
MKRSPIRSVIIDVMTGTDGEAFEAVLVSWSWWDCPRAGVALMDGQYYYFDCEFSEELDDCPSEFRLWPISGDDLADQLEAWSCSRPGVAEPTRVCGRRLSRASRGPRSWTGHGTTPGVSRRRMHG